MPPHATRKNPTEPPTGRISPDATYAIGRLHLLLIVGLAALASGFGSLPAHGFASTPDDPMKPVECYRDGRLGQMFFVYSMDMTQILVFAEAGMGVTLPENVTHGLLGKTWEGVQLSITQGTVEGGDHIHILQDDIGGSLLMPSPNIAVPQQWVFVSGDFCLPNGNWTVKVNSPKYNYGRNFRNKTNGKVEAAPGSLGYELISYQPALDWAKETYNFDLVALEVLPFYLRWSIFPAGKREEAEAVAKTGFFSLNYIADNVVDTPEGKVENSWATCGVNFTQHYWVPAPDHTCWEYYGYKDVRNYPQGRWSLRLTPEKGPCPRPESGPGDEDNRRRLSSDEPEPEEGTCSR